MQEIVITQLPKINLHLIQQRAFRDKSVQTNHHKIVHSLARQDNSLKDLKDSFANFIRKKKKNSLFDQLLQKGRSISTSNRRYQSVASLEDQQKLTPYLLVKQRSECNRFQWQNFRLNKKKRDEQHKQIFLNRQYYNHSLVRRIFPLLKSHNKESGNGSLPLIIRSSIKSTKKLSNQSTQDQQAFKKHVTQRKTSSKHICLIHRAEKGLRNQLKDYKIEGWNIDEMKCEYNTIQ